VTTILQDPLLQAVAGALALILVVAVLYRAMVQRDRERGR